MNRQKSNYQDIPKKEDNIYPWTRENVTAVLNYYLKFPDGEIEFIYGLDESSKIEINQLEHIAKSISEHIPFFERNLGADGITKSNLMKYGIDAAFVPVEAISGSKNRIRITTEFKRIMERH